MGRGSEARIVADPRPDGKRQQRFGAEPVYPPRMKGGKLDGAVSEYVRARGGILAVGEGVYLVG